MVGLEGTRVVVVDDSPNEALPVLQALSSHRIPAVWYTGRVQELPPAGKPLPNVRLALLDVDLTGGGGGERQKVSTLVRVVQRLFPTDAAGLGFVLWTRHAELKEQFLNTLLSQGGPVPAFTVTFDKHRFEQGGRFDWVSLSEKLSHSLETTFPWPFLLQWELASREGSGDVVSEVLRLMRRSLALPQNVAELDAWQSRLNSHLSTLLYGLASAALGKENLQTGGTVAYGALTALGPLLLDRLEARARAEMTELEDVGARLAEHAGGALPPGTNAAVNTSIAIAEVPSAGAWTGNIYPIGRRGGLRPAFKYIFDPATFLDEFVDTIVQPISEPSLTERKRRVRAGCLGIVLVDVNPQCDHAQGKTTCGRLLAGIKMRSAVWNARKDVKSPRPEFLWQYGPVMDPGTDEEFHFLIDLRRLISCDSKLLHGVRASSRLREAIVLDLQARLVGHGARAGAMSMSVREVEN